MRYRRAIRLLGFLLSFTVAGFSQSRPNVELLLDGSAFQPGTGTHVHFKILGKTAVSFKTPTAFYDACSVKDEDEKPDTTYAGSFCSYSGHTRIFTSKAEPLRGYPEKLTGGHTFAEPLNIPSDNPDTRIWIILNLNADLQHRYYYALSLTKYCERASGDATTAKVTCAYYTPGGLASKKAGETKVP